MPTGDVRLCDGNAATTNPGTNVVGYELHTGFSNRNYTQTLDLGNTTAVTFPTPNSGSTYYFAVTAYNSSGTNSPFSNEVSITAP